MNQEGCSQPIPYLPCSPAKGNLGGSKAWQEKLDCDRAEEKHKRMSSLGLVRTDLFPRIQALMEWRRRRRQRRQRQCKLASPSAQLQSNAVTVSLPICNPFNTGLNKECERKIDAASEEATMILEKKVTEKPKNIPAGVPQSDRGTRGKGAKPNSARASIGRRKTGNRVTPPSNGTRKTLEVACNNRSPANAKLGKHSTRRMVKSKVGNEQSRETRGVALRKGVHNDTQISAPPLMDQEKRGRLPPLKLPEMDSEFDPLQPAEKLPTVKPKKNSLDSCLRPSTSQAGEVPSCRVLRAKRPPIIPPVTKGNK